MRKLIIFVLGILSIISCQNKLSDKKEASTVKPINNRYKDYTQFVNPFIGTSKMGHTYPGATAPFGMVQLSPQTNFEIIEPNYQVFKFNSNHKQMVS